MSRVVIIILFIIAYQPLYTAKAQTRKIELAKTSIQNARNGDQKLAAIFSLCEERLSLSSDTLYAYALAARQLATLHQSKPDIMRADYFLTFYLLKNARFDSVILICDANIPILKENKKERALLVSYNYLKGQALIRSTHYKEAMVHYYRLLNEAESLGDTLMQIKCLTGLGWINMEMTRYPESLKWFYKALHTSANAEYYARYSPLYSNIASVYNNINRFDSAALYVKKAIELSSSNQELTSLANALNIRANVFMNLKNNAAAEKDLTEALSIRKQIGDPYYIVSDMSQLSFFYGEIDAPEKGIELAKQGIEMAGKYNVESKLTLLYTALAANYKQAGNMQKYGETLERVIAIKDSIYQANSAEALAEMHARYDLQKKENIIIQQEFRLVRKNYLLFGSMMLTALGVLLFYLVFKYHHRKQKTKMQLMMQQEKQIANEAVLRAEENERKRIAADLHDNMGAYASAISANVDDLLVHYNGNHHLLLSMKESVTEIMMNLRDTIWVLNKDEILITGISDRFKAYIQKIRRSYESITIDVKEKIDNNISLSPEKSLNMLRIMQEAFHNSIKHSNCTHITIEIISNKNLTVRIIDDGIGIGFSSTGDVGSGLENMRRRAHANGWKFILKNIVHEGTEVQLSNNTT
jgi:signal transduction histidine kinase